MTPVAQVVTLTIDGKEYSARTDETILDIARQNSIFIPTLCFLEGLSGWGACRMCIVEMKGSTKLFPACTTRAAQDQNITTDSPRSRQYRQTIIEMLFSERNHICSVCVSNGHCELQTMAQKLGITHIDLPYRFPKMEFDSSHDLFRLDHNRCIACTRCVRVCDEIEGCTPGISQGRGINTRVTIDLNESWGNSETCTTCGKCVRVCPTGALTRKGTGVAEMEKDQDFLSYLRLMRGVKS